MTIEQHIENLTSIMDSMPDDACRDLRGSVAYAIKALETRARVQKVYQKLQEAKIADDLKDLNRDELLACLFAMAFGR